MSNSESKSELPPQKPQAIHIVGSKISNQFKEIERGKKFGELVVKIRFREGKPVMMSESFEATTKFTQN